MTCAELLQDSSTIVLFQDVTLGNDRGYYKSVVSGTASASGARTQPIDG
jgi:hypothetical protein